MGCSSDNFSSTLFSYEQNHSQAFPPGLNFLGKKGRIDAEEGLWGDAGQIWKAVIRQHLNEVRASVKMLHKEQLSWIRINISDLDDWIRGSTLSWIFNIPGVGLRVWKGWFFSCREQWDEVPLNIVFVLCCWALAYSIFHRWSLLLLPLCGTRGRLVLLPLLQKVQFPVTLEKVITSCAEWYLLVDLLRAWPKGVCMYRLWASVLSQTLGGMLPLTRFQNTPFCLWKCVITRP